jgi:membrane-associated phospholipid phosphatase
MGCVGGFAGRHVGVFVVFCGVASARPAAAETHPAAAPGGSAPALAQPASVSAPPEPRVPAPPAQQFGEGLSCPFCPNAPERPAGPGGLHWHEHWRSVGTREYISIAVLTGALLGTELFWPKADQPRWEKPILFDDAVRGALRLDSASGRDTAATISDAIVVWGVVHSAIVDPLLVAWWQRKAPFVAWQMVTIDAQAYALSLLLSEVTKRVVARARPWAVEESCTENSSAGDCASGYPNHSFYSGHAAVSATSAGLLCAHHTQLSLYQNDVLDVGACALAVAGTALTGALRIAADNHWATDVIMGHAVGYASGYLLPTLLYYREPRVRPESDPGATFAAMPLVTGSSLGLSVFGQF